MTSAWQWPGARWWKVDLHTHSPASPDFKPAVDREAKDWAKWVASAKAAGLHAVALTDHNGPDGVEAIKAVISGTDLSVFPGVEVTVGGVHLLCVLDPASRCADVVALLASLGIRPADFHREDATSTKSVAEAIQIATKAGAVVIAAHVNGPSGLLTVLDGQQRLKPLQESGLIAAEVAPLPAEPNSEWLDPEGNNVQPWLNGACPTVGRTIPQIWCSDSHRFDEMGRRFTWIKMTRPDLEGLRLALLDGQDSLVPATQVNPGDPNTHADLVIESVSVTEAKFLGRKEPFDVSFNPWLNAIIGGRGTGKSTIVDFLRIALRREDELRSEGANSPRTVFDERMRVPNGRDDDGLLTATTSVEVVYRKDGERFAIGWNRDGSRASIELIDGENRTPEEGSVRDRFPVRIYSQKQLFDLAQRPSALLTIVDDAPEVGGSELRRLRAEAKAKYLSLRADARLLRAQVAELPARRAARTDVKRKLDVLAKGGHADALKSFRERGGQDRTWASIQAAAAASMSAVHSVADERLNVPDFELGHPADGDAALQALKRAHESVRRHVSDLRRTILAAISEARGKIAEVLAGENAMAWGSAVAASEAGYAAVSRQLAEAGIANPDEYRDLIQRAAALDHEIAALEKREIAAGEREKDAEAALTAYRTHRAELTARRTAFFAKTSGDEIKIEVVAYGARDGLEDHVRESLGIRSFDEDHAALSLRINETSGGLWSFAALDREVGAIRGCVGDPQRVWPSKDKRFDAALRKLPPERIDHMALYLPDDRVEVKYRDRRQIRSDWISIAQGSPGQQTAALLAFVLGYGDEPIILDQPEDDLDNTLIYDLLVQRLKEKKKGRQIVVVTHNPNIVVHGDAELVISFEAIGGRTKRVVEGGLQEQKVRDEVCRVMEGGRRAFETRYRRIMLSGEQRDDRS